jgi:septal ring factor EnvC (AmiA/AmiB activator)
VLDWPARGTLLETFGRHRHPKFDTWTVSNGVAVARPARDPGARGVRGRRVYAQWLAEYGNLVILDHGDGMLTLYAWLQGVGVKAGMPVAAGTEIGARGLRPRPRRAGRLLRGPGPAEGERSGRVAEVRGSEAVGRVWGSAEYRDSLTAPASLS